MKLLKALIKLQPKYTHNQVLKWLYWLRDYCDCRPCFGCEYEVASPEFPYRSCTVRSVYEGISPKTPAEWGLPRKNLRPEKPLNLEFLRGLYWSKKGNPVPPPRGGNHETAR